MFYLYIMETHAICCFKIFHMKRRELRWGWSVFNQGATRESVGSHDVTYVTIKWSRSKWNECPSKIQMRSSTRMIYHSSFFFQTFLFFSQIFHPFCDVRVPSCYIADFSTMNLPVLPLKDLAKCGSSDKGKAPKSFETSFVEVASMDIWNSRKTKHKKIKSTWAALCERSYAPKWKKWALGCFVGRFCTWKCQQFFSHRINLMLHGFFPHEPHQQFFSLLLEINCWTCFTWSCKCKLQQNRPARPPTVSCVVIWRVGSQVGIHYLPWNGGGWTRCQGIAICIQDHMYTSKLYLPMYINIYTFVFPICTPIYMSQTKDACMFFKEFDFETQPAALSICALSSSHENVHESFFQFR